MKRLASLSLTARLALLFALMTASVLVVVYGYKGAFIAISGLVLVCGLAFTVASRGLEPVDGIQAAKS